MKFTLTSLSASERLGLISNISRLQGFEMETPHAFLCTTGGTVPHLTYDTLNIVSKDSLGLSIPVQSIAHVQDQMKLYKHTIADYIGMKEYVTYCSYINAVEKNANNVYINGNIKLKTRNGNQAFSPKSYMECIEDLKPDMFVLLADGATSLKSSKKRIKKSLDNSISLFKKCMDIYKESVPLKSSQVLAAIEGGFDLSHREQFSKFIGESSVFGILIDGLYDSNEGVMEITSNDIQPTIEASLKHIPREKLRVIQGCWNPSVVLDLVNLGIDMFDSSYPCYITDLGGALAFPNTESILEKYQCNGIHKGEMCDKRLNAKDVSKTEPEEPASKKIKLSSGSKFYISMSDPCHTTDFTPIDKNCTCLTCRNHTRAYVHHLVNVREMLGDVLLMIHNLHHYLLFFSTIRKQLRCGKFQEFCRSFQMWVNEKNVSSPS